MRRDIGRYVSLVLVALKVELQVGARVSVLKQIHLT